MTGFLSPSRHMFGCLLKHTHGAEPFLRSNQLCSHSRTSQHFTEPEGLITCSQELSTGPYPEPYQSNPSHPISLRSILKRTCPIHASDIPCTNSHVHFISFRTFIQGIRPGPRPLLNVRNKHIFYGEVLLAHAQPPKLEDHPLSAVATAYSIYSQLPSKTGGRLLHPKPEDAPCRDDVNKGVGLGVNTE
jgi:hypothetical protein